MRRINYISAAVGAISVFLMALLIVANIAGRKLGYPVPGAIAMAGFMLVVVTFLGLAPCEEAGGHVRVETLLQRLSPNYRLWLTIFGLVLSLGMSGLMVWGATNEAITAWQIMQVIPEEMPLPVYPTKTIVSIGCGLMAIQIIINIVEVFRNRKDIVRKDLG